MHSLLGAVLLLGWNPYTLFDAGFQLSFAAVLAIFLAVGPVLRLLEGYPVPPKPAAALAVSVACSVATAPILWLQFQQVPLLGVLANVLVEPVVGVLLGLGLVTALVGPVLPRASRTARLAPTGGSPPTSSRARAVAAVPFAQATGSRCRCRRGRLLLAAAYAWQRWLRHGS